MTTLDLKTAAFLTHLHRGGNWAYWRVRQTNESIWWPVDSPAPLPDASVSDVYFPVYPLREVPTTNALGVPRSSQYVRGRKEHVAAVNSLFADFDLKDFANSQDLFAHILGLAVAPSVLIWSGAGLHAYWLLTDPFVISSTDHRTAIEYIERMWVAHIGGDPGAADLARTLRVPNSLNHKYGQPHFVGAFTMDLQRTYALADLTIHLPPPPPPRPITPSPMPHTTSARPIDTFNQSVAIGDLLERYGYVWCGRYKMLSPFSTTGQPGVTIDTTRNRCFVHHGSDPLCDRYWHSPFDIVSILDFSGDWRKALDSVKAVL